MGGRVFKMVAFVDSGWQSYTDDCHCWQEKPPINCLPVRPLIPVLALWLASCNLSPASHSGALWQVLDDVPIPSSYRPVQGRLAESEALSIGQYRSAKILLRGKSSPESAMAYMEDRLPEFGWEAESPPGIWKKPDVTLEISSTDDPEGVYGLSLGESLLRLEIRAAR